MKDYQSQYIRNIALVGHGGEGKTTLAEALLWTTGAIDRMGRVEDGNTVSDYDAEEIKRQFSISTSVAPVEWKDHKINFIDIPGYFDFIGEMMGPLRIVDAALIVIDAVTGLSVGAEKAMAYTAKHNIPRAIFVNGMDRENANFDKVIEQLQEKYQTAVCPVMLPIYEKDKFIGYSSLVTDKSYRYLDKFSKEVDTAPEMQDKIDAIWEQVTEAAASADDELMEKYFETGELTDDEKLLGWYGEKGLSAKSYYLVVGRFVPENNYETMIREFMKSNTQKDFAIITNVNDKFLQELEQKLHYQADPRIKFVGTVYDQELLMKIRENAYGYFHGHEVGGTNPSLLEALGCTDLNLLLGVGFNREVAEEAALYWTKDDGDLARLIEQADTLSAQEISQLGVKAKQRIADAYSWQFITDEYRKLFLEGQK